MGICVQSPVACHRYLLFAFTPMIHHLSFQSSEGEGVGLTEG